MTVPRGSQRHTFTPSLMLWRAAAIGEDSERTSELRMGRLTSAFDPKQPPRFLRSGRSPKSAISELGFYEAAVGDLTLPANSGPSDGHEIALPSGRFWQ